MSVRINGQRKRLGPALSGGGFRAPPFHLGVFRKLQDHKLLDEGDLLSRVRGGRIAGAFLAPHRGRPTALDGRGLQFRRLELVRERREQWHH